MKLFKQIFTASALVVATLSMGAYAETSPLDKLLQDVKANRISDAKLDKKRESEFTSARDQQQALLNKAKKELAFQDKRQKDLTKAFYDNEKKITEKEIELDNSKGTLGEMFGVVRQQSGDAVGRIKGSIISAQPQYSDRTAVLEILAEAKELPELSQLEELWLGLMTEMTESGKVVKFDATVVGLDGTESTQTVTRVGTFNLLADDIYLKYNIESNQIEPLGRQPAGYMVSAVSKFNNTTETYESLFVDPSRGAILDIFKQKATLLERYHQGGIPGYVITFVLLFGALIALERFITLTLVGSKIKSQLKDPSNPKTSNPLGRILGVYNSNKNVDTETLELKLDEAILRETPSIERGVNVIKILAAIAPLLGLLGTVVGMIGTFQTITLFGTGDPKLMAGDISMALVTTAQGLIAALPLIFLHSITASKSKSIVHVLEEQSAGIVASHAEQERN